MFARTARRTAVLIALSALATAQAPTIQPKSHASLLEVSQSGSSLAGLPFEVEAAGLVIGVWIDPSTSQLGSMTGELFDAAGQLEYTLAATVSEYIASGSGLRFGGIKGALYKGSGAPAGIKISGDWTLDPVTNKGTFELTCYLSASPTAPLLAVGSMEGVLGKPLAMADEAAVPVPSAGSAGSLGTFSKKGGPGGGGGGTLMRDFRGRWKMI